MATGNATPVQKQMSWRAPLRNLGGLATVLLLYLALATVYLTVVPPLEGFDAAAHMNAVNYWRQEQTPPMVDLPTNQYSYELLTQPPLYYMLAALATAWLPAKDADGYVRESANRYFPGLSTRQSIDLPGRPMSVEMAMVVARLVSLVGGVLTVGATWLWVRVEVPDQRWLPTAVAAAVACNPLFLFISTAVTNDAWAAAGTVTVIWLMTTTAAQPAAPIRQWLLVGMVAGLATLTKYSTLLVAIPALLILLQYGRYRPFSRFLWIAAALFGGAALTAGWWYGRNLLLYGEPIPLTAMRTVITTLQRPEMLSLTDVWTLLPFLFYSYWGLFVATFAPDRFFGVMQWAVLVALIGLPLSLRWRRRQPISGRMLAVALLWFVVNLVSMVNYMRLVSYGEQARFLLTAAPAIALLLVCGWQAWVPLRLVPALRMALLPALFLLALWPLPTLRDAYAQPPQAPTNTPMRQVHAQFVGGMQLVGYALLQGAALHPGDTLPLTLYFTTDHPITASYTLFIHLVDSEDRLLYQVDGVPFAGRHPPRQWQPGQVFADTYHLTVEARPRADQRQETTLTQLIVGFYEYEAPTKRLTVYDAEGTLIGDRLVLGPIRLLSDENRVPSGEAAITEPPARWQAGIELLTAQVTEGKTGQYAVDLDWRTTTLLNTNYTVFLQFLNANGEVVAQVDQQPQAGAAPTSTWLVNERIVDTYRLTPPADWAQLIVGFYDAESGERLRLHTPTPDADYVTLAEK